jgi:polysaccharide export outer membrane protein
MKRLLLLLFGLLFFAACVPTKKLTYLKENEALAQDSANIYKLDRSSSYQLQTNDIITVNVRSFDQETSALFNIGGNMNGGGAAGGGQGGMNGGDMLFYLQGYPVDQSGFIEMPILGPVQVIGKTIEEVQTIVEQKLNSYFVEDAVFVTVRLAGIRFTIVGEVNAPGRNVIFANQVSIFEALAQSGGISLVGDRTNVMILRQTPAGMETHYVDLTQADVLTNPLYFIQPNDLINVQPLPQKSWGTGTTGIGTFTTILSVVASSIALYVAFGNF